MRSIVKATLVGITITAAALIAAPAAPQTTTFVEDAAELARACEANDMDACYRRGTMSTGSTPGIPEDASLQLRYFSKACDADHGEACGRMGSVWMRGVEGTKDLPLARRLFAKSCNLDVASSCGLFGKMAAWGLGGPVDYDNARLAFDLQCQLDGTQCEGDAIIAEARTRANARTQASAPRTAPRQRTSSSVPANVDSQCVANYNSILAIDEGITDAEIRWAFAYEAAVRDGRACPPNFPARARPVQRRRNPPVASGTNRQTPGSSGNSGDGARSGFMACTKANGGSGQQYWYYGFDNRRKYGPCF